MINRLLDIAPAAYWAVGAAIVGLLALMLIWSPAVHSVAIVLLVAHVGCFVRRWMAIEDATKSLNSTTLFDLLGIVASLVRRYPWGWSGLAVVWIYLFGLALWSAGGAWIVSAILLGCWGVMAIARTLPNSVRARQMRSVADSFGFGFQTTPTVGDVQENPTWLELTTVRAVGRHWMRGNWEGFQVEIFDFDYGENDALTRTAVCLRGSAIQLPKLQLRPHRLPHPIANLCDVSRSSFGIDGELARNYVLRSDDANVGMLFNGPVAAFFDGLDDVVLEAGSGIFAMYRNRTPCPVGEVPQLLERTSQLLELLRAEQPASLLTS